MFTKILILILIWIPILSLDLWTFYSLEKKNVYLSYENESRSKSFLQWGKGKEKINYFVILSGVYLILEKQ